MRKATITVIFCAVLAAAASAGDLTDSPINWVKSFDDAVAQAKNTGQHLVVQFWTPT